VAGGLGEPKLAKVFYSPRSVKEVWPESDLVYDLTEIDSL